MTALVNNTPVAGRAFPDDWHAISTTLVSDPRNQYRSAGLVHRATMVSRQARHYSYKERSRHFDLAHVKYSAANVGLLRARLIKRPFDLQDRASRRESCANDDGYHWRK